MAAIALAMRLYEVDHGRRPAKLAELVPDYLSEVPADPHASDGRSIAYQPKATAVGPPGGVFNWPYTPALKRPHPVLYSVGPDGRDDNGKGGTLISLNGDCRGDIVFHLTVYQPEPTVSQPESKARPSLLGFGRSPQTAEDDDDAADDQRDADEDQRGQ